MKTLVNRVVLFVAGALILGSVAYGQTTLKANIPFAFRAGTASLPAGTYTVRMSASGAPQVYLWNDAARRSAFSQANPRDYALRGTPQISFRCQNGSCSLSQIRTVEGALSYPSSRKGAHEMQAVSVISIPLTAMNGD